MNSQLSSLSKPNRYVVRVILLNLFSLGIGGILVGSFLPMLRADYGLSYSTGGLLVSAFNIGTMGRDCSRDSCRFFSDESTAFSCFL